MRFFIISKRLFKTKDKERKNKREISKKTVWIWAVSVAAVGLLLSGWVIYSLSSVPSRSYAEGIGEYSLEAKTKSQRESFFEQFGYTAKEVYEQEIRVPCDSESFKEYNDLQKSQGLDLNPYCGKTAKMYTMRIYGDDTREVFGVIIVFKGRVIGAHLTDMEYPATLSPLAAG